MTKISPSLLAADFTNLSQEITRINESQADWLHLDVMDGNFVPNISYGFDIIKQIRPLTDIYFDCHLMIEKPHDYIKNCAQAGCNLVTIHLEAFENNEQIIKTIDLIKSYNMDVGLSIKPNTDVILLKPYLHLVNVILIMSVEPGFGGQSFIEKVLEKVTFLATLKKQDKFNYLIEIDGGINQDTAKKAIESGCDVLVAGTYIFSGDIDQRIEKLKNEV